MGAPTRQTGIKKHSGTIMNQLPMAAQHAASRGHRVSEQGSNELARTGQLLHHDIIFTGSGSEYFRIWVVNLLLMVATLGLYFPWARVRKLRYFSSNTVVAGYPLSFDAQPRRMLRGFLLVSTLMVAYTLAGQSSAFAGGIAGLILVAIWPALARASLQFRLAHTRWRGQPLAFTGSLKDAYLVLMVPLVALVGLGLLALLSSTLLSHLIGPRGGLLALVATGMAACALLPFAWWRLKCYQHNHYALSQQQTVFKASLPAVTGIFFKTGLLALVGLALVAGVVWSVFSATGHGLQRTTAHADWLATLSRTVVLLLVSGLLLQLVTSAYYTSRMHNLLWTKTGNHLMRFRGHLHFWPLLRLYAVNSVLMLLTLGLYWPFAAIAVARIKLHATELVSRQRSDQFLTQAQAARLKDDATGDLANDLIGIDLGL
jgi:uncharacterized membrane protein YjgN (DUF898 family)